ncbi:conserved hypothetical protein [Candidatus Methylobacter favarea]|uniref:Uncharacterized protein n=1 Tax=Candidatus Methylobacter favarea TaxID=2707345 RepID=A0A8S0XK18_9GAMM|nr:hypothetical protein [Candidatus Methylobacter favarea]CAA9891740.1 conserved hypothetical protein [Candidatus Methylobacter favarea]
MKAHKLFWILVLTIINSNIWAYGGSSSSSQKACAKPRFTEFVPAEKAEMAAQSAFSFTASPNTNPDSIKVAIKDQPVDVKVTPKAQGFQVSGTLPDKLKGGYARININAEGHNKCKGSGGWLVKIAE